MANILGKIPRTAKVYTKAETDKAIEAVEESIKTSKAETDEAIEAVEESLAETDEAIKAVEESLKTIEDNVQTRPQMIDVGGGQWVFLSGDTGGFVVVGGVVTELPASKTSFTDSEYGSNTNLTYVYAPNVTEVGSHAFDGCSELTTVFLPSATSIGSEAFPSTSLSSISLPAATTIGDYAFNYCESLTSISLPAATIIGEEVFYACNALATLDLSSISKADIETNAESWAIPSGCVVTCAGGETYTVP